MSDPDFDPIDTDTAFVVGDTAAELLGLPASLLGCFPNDPVSQVNVLDDWGHLDLTLPRDVFALASGGSSGRPARVAPAPPPPPVTPASMAVASLEASLDRRLESIRREPVVKAPPPGSGLPAVGSVIDKYRIEELLGTGGFAAVYRATHLLLRIPVALKLLKPEVVRTRPFLAELLCEEARFAAQLNHPNVVRVFDVTHTPQITYIIMEFIEGESLMETIHASGPLALKRVLSIGLDVARGLQAASLQGMIHRDIKPANILMTKGGLAKIVDLGLAQQRTAEGRGPETNMVVGTPAYMAPEQALHPEEVDFRADIYSLGVTLYHAALGRPPFQGRTPVESISLHQTQPVPAPQDIIPTFPFELSRVLLWMLEKDPQDRPGSYEQLVEGLEETLQSLALQSLLD
jgi:serine/threonine protein kinase